MPVCSASISMEVPSVLDLQRSLFADLCAGHGLRADGAGCGFDGPVSECEGSGAAFDVPCLFLVNTLRKLFLLNRAC